MPKVKLEFSLPEESQELDEALHGYKYKLILQELHNKMRGIVKHNSKIEHIDYNAAEKFQQIIYDELQDKGVELYE